MRLIALFVIGAALFPAPEVGAQEARDFCKNPTEAQRNDRTLMDECRQVEEYLTRRLNPLEGLRRSLAEQFDRALDDLQHRLLEQNVPKEKRPSERVPSSPNELKR